MEVVVGQLVLKLSLCHAGKLGDDSCQGVCIAFAGKQGDLVQAVADGDKGTCAKIAGGGGEGKKDVQVFPYFDVGIEGNDLECGLGAAAGFATGNDGYGGGD